nr:hypothetical protein [Mesorhizobium sp. WSM4313]
MTGIEPNEFDGVWDWLCRSRAGRCAGRGRP